MRKALILVLTLFVAIPLIAQAYTASWSPVTKYTDNTAIGPEANGVFYTLEMDGLTVVTKTPSTSWAIPPVAKKTVHTFRAKTVLGTGEESLWSPPFSWTSPAGNPMAPGQLKVVP